MVASSQHAQGLLNERAVSKILGVSLGSLRRWRLLRQGPAFIKLGAGRGGAVRYPIAELEAWLASRPSGGQEKTDVDKP